MSVTPSTRGTVRAMLLRSRGLRRHNPARRSRGHATAGYVAAAVVLLVALACFIGPLFYETEQRYGELSESSLPPGSPGHPLGTDSFGFDLLGRLLVGGQLSLVVGLSAAIFATGFGALWGAVSGYAGGRLDGVMMRIIDALSSIPSLFILIYLSTVMTINLPTLILLISYVAWVSPARLVRGETLSLKMREYVAAARTMGGGPSYIIRRHLLPNSLGTILVSASFQVADAILYVAALGYLGVSLPGQKADWGTLLSNGIQYTQAGYWWMILFPGAAIVLVVTCFYLIGDAMSDAFTTRGRTQL